MPTMPRRGCAYGLCPRRAVAGSSYCEEHRQLVERERDQRYNADERSEDVNRKYGRAWREVRRRYALAHPYCERCYAEGRMVPMDEVHHIIPVSRGGTNADENLMSLCRSCHIKMHQELGDR